jgi:4a-hydroxytetrahydrobiopterin dehydratase
MLRERCLRRVRAHARISLSNVGGLSAEDIDAAGLDDWRKLSQALHGRWATDDLSAGAAFLTECNDSADHVLEARLRSSWIELRLATYDGSWIVTAEDVAAAHRISDVARRQGLRPEPSAVVQVEIGLDSARIPLQGPFWSALLSGRAGNFENGEVVDADSRFPNLWFQSTDAHPTPRQRFHLDVWVAPEVAEQRIEAAVAAGGQIVDEDQSPTFTVLADPEGNRVCICTYLGR